MNFFNEEDVVARCTYPFKVLDFVLPLEDRPFYIASAWQERKRRHPPDNHFVWLSHLLIFTSPSSVWCWIFEEYDLVCGIIPLMTETDFFVGVLCL